jgi:hypothetical protein
MSKNEMSITKKKTKIKIFFSSGYKKNTKKL